LDIKLSKALQKTYSEENKRKVEVACAFVAEENQPLQMQLWDKNHKIEVRSNHYPEKAISNSTSKEGILKQLHKTGGTPFDIHHCTIKLDDHLFIPVSEINDIRRRALEELEEMKKQKYSHRNIQIMDYSSCPSQETDKNPRNRANKTKIALFMWNLNHDFQSLDVDRLYIPFREMMGNDFEDKIKNVSDSTEIVAWIPAITRGNADYFIRESIRYPLKDRISGIMIGNLGQIQILKEWNKNIYGDTSLNIFNKEAIKVYKNMGLKGIALSNELNLKDVEEISQEDLELEAIVYGRVPVMTMEYCPIGKSIRKNKDKPCRLCSLHSYCLLDRMGKQFPLITDQGDCRVTLLNTDKIDVPDLLLPLKEKGISVFRLYAHDESAEEMAEILVQYRKALMQPYKDYNREKGYTSGHYRRGV